MSGRKKSCSKVSTEGQGDSRRPLNEWLAMKLDIPADVFDGGMRVELRGRNTLLIHGCRRILSYTPELLRFRMKGCVMSIRGERLVCQAFLAGAVGVEGSIDAIEFEVECV